MKKEYYIPTVYVLNVEDDVITSSGNLVYADPNTVGSGKEDSDIW